jgi:hypothetical protein
MIKEETAILSAGDAATADAVLAEAAGSRDWIGRLRIQLTRSPAAPAATTAPNPATGPAAHSGTRSRW